MFVVGASRSGTTLMSRVVSRSGEVRALAEVHFFERLWSPAAGAGVLGRPDAVELAARLVHTQHRGLFYRHGHSTEHTGTAVTIVDAVAGPLTALAVYGAFLDHEARRRGGARACDQTPRNVFFLDSILGTFADARVVNMVRDPRAVMMSQKHKWRRRSLGESGLPRFEVMRAWSNYHPLVTTRLWRAAVDAADRVTDARVLTVRFEDLLADPEPTVRRVAEHCEVEYSPAMLDVPMESSSIASDDPGGRGLRSEAADAWRQYRGMSASEVALCEQVAREAMVRHGYRPDGRAPGRVAAAGWYAVAPVKLACAAALNLRTVRNPIAAARRRLGR